jgi:hypothetical protein
MEKKKRLKRYGRETADVTANQQWDSDARDGLCAEASHFVATEAFVVEQLE